MAVVGIVVADGAWLRDAASTTRHQALYQSSQPALRRAHESCADMSAVHDVLPDYLPGAVIVNVPGDGNCMLSAVLVGAEHQRVSFPFERPKDAASLRQFMCSALHEDPMAASTCWHGAEGAEPARRVPV